MVSIKMLTAVAAVMAVPCTFAATGKNPGQPNIRTMNGKVLFDTGSGAILTLESSQPLSCPEQKTTPAPPSPPKKEAITATVAADKVGWFEAAPELMPRYSEPGADRYVYALGVGLGGKLFYNPRAKRVFECKFVALGGSKSKLETTSGFVVKSKEMHGEMFYDVACLVPEVSQPPAKYTLSVHYKGESIEFIGAKGNSDFELTSYVTKFSYSGSKGVVTVTGAGLDSAGKYKCVFLHAGANTDATASVVDTTQATCPVPAFTSSKREAAVKVSLFDLSLKAAVKLQGSANEIAVDTCADGVKNNAETDVDCGGSQCPGCGVQKACGKKSDCDSQEELICESKKCIVPDKDGDGQSEAEGDCDDTNPKIYKGAKEVRDGLDNDCDGKGMDGDFETSALGKGVLANGHPVTSQSEWEFTEFILKKGLNMRPFNAQNPFTIWSIKKAVIAGDVNFFGGGGARSIQAYSYKNVEGGQAGPGGNNHEGATGPGGCNNQGNSNFAGKGPGGGVAAQCTSYGPGGSGAGHQAQGATGGRSPNYGGPPGGKAYGSDDKPTMSPGSGGGAGAYGSARNQGGSAGGGGGGTFHLVAPSIEVSGQIFVNGGNGGTQGGNSGDGGTGGGGSGGTVWLESSDKKGTIKVTGVINAAGGKGGRILHRGGTGGNGSEGRIWYNRDVGTAGNLVGWKKKYSD